MTQKTSASGQALDLPVFATVMRNPKTPATL